ncbi:hypothetical protein BU25DRAFT_448545 [Macroventuria anomochaeta]|uniref:Uncharacterized protein n=1 Tax=Macroventuria anomochaeta TaxID=301207 RepID=A0ACB6S299_9PLEO|nr:uncharacterized protein BU25DRAFT_448545 [Macroventuria anomochaeta]KAF2627642.1 hypothetical protein BU25DRAFT_448545 [Macroventuria anomochaeta]
MPLAETTTSDVVLKKGEVAKRQSEAAEKRLLHSFLLDEEHVLFPGDPDGYELNWLGNAPFMQVQADGGFAQSSGLYGSRQCPNTSEDNRPQALTLHVKLSDKTFVSGFSGKTHLKIEALFNGQLSACSLIHTNDIRSGAKSLHQVFAGYRVDFLAERPWVLLPPYTTADGGTRRFRKTITPPERWEQISAALLKEAEERGTDRDGKSPPSGEFLHALASMQMPECVGNMQKPGGRKFGVVDVVITAGIGSKLTTGTNYLKRPQRLKDSNYTVRTEPRPSNEVATADFYQTQDAADKLTQGTHPDLDKAYVDLEEDTDTQHQRPRKRQALFPVRTLSQHAQKSLDFQSPFSGAQIPYLPPPNQSPSHHDLSPIAGRVSPRCPPPEHRSDSHNERLPSNDRSRTYEMIGDISKAQEKNSSASLISLEYHSSPTNPQTMNAHEATGSPLFVSSASGSSPMPQTFGHYTSPLAQPMLPSGIGTPTSTSIPGPSTPYVAPTALMQPTTLAWKSSSNAMTSPYYPTHVSQQAPLGMYPPGLVPYMPPNRLPSLLPHTPPFFGHPGPAQLATPVTLSPPAFQSCGPLPPTAMFAVTSKPKRSALPTKDAALIDLDAPHSSVLVNRLVITGLNGMLVIDHRWKVAQRIIVSHNRLGEGEVDGRADTPGSEYEEPKARSRARKQSTLRNKTFQAGSRASSPIRRLQSDTTEHSTREQRRDSIQDGQADQAIHVSLPYLKKHQGPTDEDLPVNHTIDVPDKIAAFVTAPILTTTAPPILTPTPVHASAFAPQTQSTMPQRRTLSRNALPGIQGPKAATFLLDDPEEVLREAARMRRSRSPTKPAATTSVPPISPPAQLESTTAQGAPGGSSPLSSVPSSPLPERSAEVVDAGGTAPDQIPQLDGSLEHTIPFTSPRKLQTPSPTKSSFPTPKFRCPGPATPQSSASSDSKKRKASHRSPTKPPRSPGRLKTVDNPPLNDDCVIVFAESIDKGEEKGVLRQVKGERQGVFKEEYVVLAVRFFIAGD